MDPRQELEELRRLDELEAKAKQSAPAPTTTREDVQNAMLTRQIMGGGMFGQNMPDVVKGAVDVPVAVVQAISKIFGKDLSGADKIEAAYQKYFQPEAAAGSSIGRGIGQAAATAPLMPFKAAATLPKAIAQGAAMGGASGALTPVLGEGDFWEEKAKQAGIGAATGAAGAGILGSAGRMVAPNTAPEVRALMDAGVTPTPGQVLGGGFKRTEEALTSVPLLGDMIKGGQKRALEQYNRAIYTRALAPLGKEGMEVAKTAPVGNEGIAKIGDFLSSKYDDVLSKVTVTADPTFMKSNLQLGEMVKSLPEQQQKQFGTFLQRTWNEFTPAGTMTGESMKALDGKLGSVVRQYKGSPDPDHRELSKAVQQLQSNLRQLVSRSAPEHAPTIKAIDNGWANLTQLENAGSMLGAKEGVITPAQFLNAVKKGDTTVRDRAFARGQARNQDLAQAGDKVLSNKVPDSGTPLRGMTAGVAGGGLGALGLLNPMMAATAAATLAPYTQIGQKAMAGLLTKRPKNAHLVGDQMKDLAPYLGLLAPGLLGR